MISIAIDGPSGAGKSSLSRRLAAKLGYLYADTGALYRVIGLAVLRDGKDPKNEQEVVALLPSIHFSLRYVDGLQRVFLGDEDVSEIIRDEKVSMAASDVSAFAPVRTFLLETQRRLAREHDVIMDGRDIGTVVLPNANVKIFLTASVDDRAQRRYEQLLRKGKQAEYETVKHDVEQRDYNDSHRAVAPLKKADDAILMDTSGFAIERSLASLLELITIELEKQKEAGK